MSIDSNSISLNAKVASNSNINDYLANSAGGYLQFDPVETNLAASDDFNALPDNVKIALNSTGVFSLNPVDGWTKTNLNANLAKLFSGNTIYTPPLDSIDFFNNYRIMQSNKSRFDDFLSTVFYEPPQDDQQDSYENSLLNPDPLASLLNFDSFKK